MMGIRIIWFAAQLPLEGSDGLIHSALRQQRDGFIIRQSQRSDERQQCDS